MTDRRPTSDPGPPVRQSGEASPTRTKARSAPALPSVPRREFEWREVGDDGTFRHVVTFPPNDAAARAQALAASARAHLGEYRYRRGDEEVHADLAAIRSWRCTGDTLPARGSTSLRRDLARLEHASRFASVVVAAVHEAIALGVFASADGRRVIAFVRGKLTPFA